jgi:hypothetical protein
MTTYIIVHWPQFGPVFKGIFPGELPRRISPLARKMRTTYRSTQAERLTFMPPQVGFGVSAGLLPGGSQRIFSEFFPVYAI